MQTCAHCQKTIGQLEPVFAWNDKIICGDCQQTLESVSSQRPAVVEAVDREALLHRPPRVQLIERTSKFWKLQISLALLLMLIGVVLVSMGVYRFVVPPTTTRWLPLGSVLFFVGMIWLLVARAGAWWDHG